TRYPKHKRLIDKDKITPQDVQIRAIRKNPHPKENITLYQKYPAIREKDSPVPSENAPLRPRAGSAAMMPALPSSQPMSSR
ncbi:MAG: hypothetical protein KAR47_09995, partial [Planctomycetes bacterium]|nr:hypothetical protein [Planctomycetota bacterium]